ncbi:uridine kinase family protein [Acidipropionibacterium timonense]|uniref:uridine kinase family protein n=1 Tax=Acidipropionibacterium timonense TaxID=2161818 RepID=UPI001030874A
MARTIILLAGPSGSGKSRLVRTTSLPQLRLDDFYRDGSEPGLPRQHGRIDWDDVRTWNLGAAVEALHTLATTGRAVTPRYDLSRSRADGTHVVDLGQARALVAEGIFATDLLAPCRDAGLDVVPIWLDRPREVNFARRLVRDLRQHRKAPSVLVRRGLELRAREPSLRSRAVALGFRPMSMGTATRVALEAMGTDQPFG